MASSKFKAQLMFQSQRYFQTLVMCFVFFMWTMYNLLSLHLLASFIAHFRLCYLLQPFWRSLPTIKLLPKCILLCVLISMGHASLLITCIPALSPQAILDRSKPFQPFGVLRLLPKWNPQDFSHNGFPKHFLQFESSSHSSFSQMQVTPPTHEIFPKDVAVRLLPFKTFVPFLAIQRATSVILIWNSFQFLAVSNSCYSH